MDDEADKKNLQLQKYHEMIETEVKNIKESTLKHPDKLTDKFLEHLPLKSAKLSSDRRTMDDRTAFL